MLGDEDDYYYDPDDGDTLTHKQKLIIYRHNKCSSFQSIPLLTSESTRSSISYYELSI